MAAATRLTPLMMQNKRVNDLLLRLEVIKSEAIKRGEAVVWTGKWANGVNLLNPSDLALFWAIVESINEVLDAAEVFHKAKSEKRPDFQRA